MIGYMLKVIYLFGEIVSFTVFRLYLCLVFEFLNLLLVVAPGRRNYSPSECGLHGCYELLSSLRELFSLFFFFKEF